MSSWRRERTGPAHPARERTGSARVDAVRAAGGGGARAAGWRRRLDRQRLAVLVLVTLAALSALSAVRHAQPTVSVVVTTRDLAAGTVLSRADLRVADVPADMAPGHSYRAVAAVLDRTLAGPARAGEPLTDARVIGPGLLVGAEGLVAATVRVADPAAARLVRVGDVVDVLAARGSADAQPTVSVVAAAARVLAVPSPSDRADSEGALVVVATTPATAAGLAAAATVSRLSVTVHPH